MRLGYRNQLEAISDPAERQRAFDELLADAYARGKATNAAAVFELDDVIDPAETRRWITASLPPASHSTRRSTSRYVDTW